MVAIWKCFLVYDLSIYLYIWSRYYNIYSYQYLWNQKNFKFYQEETVSKDPNSKMPTHAHFSPIFMKLDLIKRIMLSINSLLKQLLIFHKTVLDFTDQSTDQFVVNSKKKSVTLFQVVLWYGVSKIFPNQQYSKLNSLKEINITNLMLL